MAALPTHETTPARHEERMLLHGVGWKEYVVMRELLDSPGLRMTYLKGALELMSPSPEHELWKTNIARLVELFAYVRGIDLRGYGSTTFRKEAVDRGAEPDECYLVGKKLADVPEIVLEVVYTPPRIDKLTVYSGLRVPEVWIFRDGTFAVHVLDPAAGRYRAVARSERMPELDLAVVARYATREDTLQALREFEAAVRASESGRA